MHPPQLVLLQDHQVLVARTLQLEVFPLLEEHRRLGIHLLITLLDRRLTLQEIHRPIPQEVHRLTRQPLAAMEACQLVILVDRRSQVPITMQELNLRRLQTQSSHLVGFHQSS